MCVSTEPTHKQFTVMVIKPDAVQAGKIDEIIERVRCCVKFLNLIALQVKAEGMEVLAIEERVLSKEEATP